MKKYEFKRLLMIISVSALLMGVFSLDVFAASNEFELIKTEISFDSACSYYRITNTEPDAMKESTLRTLSLADTKRLKDRGYVNGIKQVIGAVSNGRWEWQLEEPRLQSINRTPKTTVVTPEIVDETPKTMNGTPSSMNETPKTINETPKTMNGTPEVINETLKTMNGTLSASNGTPEIINETPTTINGTQEITEETPKIIKTKVWKKIGDTIAVQETSSPIINITLDYSRISVLPGKSVSVRYCADFERELTKDGLTVAVDHVPSFDGDDYHEWAWWNSTTFVVVIHATNLTESDFNVNNCSISDRGDGYWHLYANHSDFETSRALVHKTLFYGTDGSDPRVTGISGLEDLQVPNASRDIGKRAFYARITGSFGINGDTIYYTGTFKDTSTNHNSSVWAYTYVHNGGNQGDLYTQLEFPMGTIVQKSRLDHTDGTESNDTFGRDMSAYQQDNPTTARLYAYQSDATSVYDVRAVILASGNMNWSFYGDSLWYTDFYSNHSIPSFITYSRAPDMSTSIANSSDGSNQEVYPKSCTYLVCVYCAPRDNDLRYSIPLVLLLSIR